MKFKFSIIGLLLTAAILFAHADGINVPFSIPATTCTNQFIRSIAAVTGVGTCATVNFASDGTGIVPAASGGAGTINGALKGNGSGTVSQAACADLSNGATGCSTATGTSGATIPLNNGNNAFSGTFQFTGGVAATGSNGQGTAAGDATLGAIIRGKGSSRDVGLYNNAGSVALYVLTGATDIIVNGTITATLSSAAQTSAVCYNSGTGLITFNSGVTTCLASTATVKNLKRPIEPLEGLRTVLAMQPWVYTSKDGFSGVVPGDQVGLVAEKVALVDDRLVARDPQGKPTGVRYEQYTAMLTAAIVELEKQNRRLERRLELIEKKAP